MIKLKFTGWYSYAESLVKRPGGADGPGVYVFGIYADKLQRVIPMYVGESDTSIWTRIIDHILKHTRTYRIFNLVNIIKDPKGDKRFYKTLNFIAWENRGLGNTKQGYYSHIYKHQPKIWKWIDNNTLYENNIDYLNVKYGHIKPITSPLEQKKLLLYLNDQKIVNSFVKNWQVFSTRLWFTFVPIPKRILEETNGLTIKDLESLVHRHLAERIKKNMALKSDDENRTTLVGRITGQKLPLGDIDINIDNWFDGEVKASDLLK